MRNIQAAGDIDRNRRTLKVLLVGPENGVHQQRPFVAYLVRFTQRLGGREPRKVIPQVVACVQVAGAAPGSRSIAVVEIVTFLIAATLSLLAFSNICWAALSMDLSFI